MVISRYDNRTDIFNTAYAEAQRFGIKTLNISFPM